MSTLKEIKAALGTVGRILTAAEPLTELEVMHREELASRGACSVCQDTRKVGAEGHEIPCPSCMQVEVIGPVCKTCRDTGKVGSKGHQVKCPLCKG